MSLRFVSSCFIKENISNWLSRTEGYTAMNILLLPGILILNIEHLFINFLHRHHAPENGCYSEVSSMPRVTCCHHVLSIKHLEHRTHILGRNSLNIACWRLLLSLNLCCMKQFHFPYLSSVTTIWISFCTGMFLRYCRTTNIWPWLLSYGNRGNWLEIQINPIYSEWSSYVTDVCLLGGRNHLLICDVWGCFGAIKVSAFLNVTSCFSLLDAIFTRT